MILVVIRMKVLPEKRLVLSQTITLLIGSMKTEPGDDASTTALNTKVETNKGVVTMYDKASSPTKKDLITI